MARVLLPLAPGCEEIEAVTVIDLLRRANIDVVIAGLSEKPVRCSRGVLIIPDVTLDSIVNEDFDMIILPGGGVGAENLKNDFRITELLQRFQKEDKFIAAICAAPGVLASAGVLNGRRTTCYPGSLSSYSDFIVLENDPVVIDQRIVTSRGPGTAIDFALVLIKILTDQTTASAVEAELIRS